MRRILLTLVLLALAAPAALAQAAFPEKIALPNGFAPEGIEIGTGTPPTSARSAAAPSGSPTSVPVQGDHARRGRAGHALGDGHRVRPRPALGLGRPLRQRPGLRRGTAATWSGSSSSRPGPGATFINDAAATRQGVYFTDSQRPVIYRARWESSEVRPGAVTTIPLSGDYVHVAGQFNLNGIVATRERQDADRRPDLRQEAAHDRPDDRRREDDRHRHLRPHERRRAAAAGPHAVRRPEPRQQGRRLRALTRPDEGDVPADDHRSRQPRRPDHDRQVGQPALRRQRPLRDDDADRPGVPHRPAQLNVTSAPSRAAGARQTRTAGVRAPRAAGSPSGRTRRR